MCDCVQPCTEILDIAYPLIRNILDSWEEKNKNMGVNLYHIYNYTIGASAKGLYSALDMHTHDCMYTHSPQHTHTHTLAMALPVFGKLLTVTVSEVAGEATMRVTQARRFWSPSLALKVLTEKPIIGTVRKQGREGGGLVLQ